MSYDPLARVLALLPSAKRVSVDHWAAACPAHADTHASLSVSLDKTGVGLHCHAGCKTPAIVHVMGLCMADLFFKKDEGRKMTGKITNTYDYCDAAGTQLFQVVRFEPKDFRQRRPDPKHAGGWIWNLEGVPRVLYRIPDLLKLAPNAAVVIAEGEKDVDNLWAMRIPATTCPQGAGKWNKLADDSILVNRPILIIADKDDAGRRHAQDVATRLAGRADGVCIIEMPGEKVKDISDWMAAGGTADEFIELLDQAKRVDSDLAAEAMVDIAGQEVAASAIDAVDLGPSESTPDDDYVEVIKPSVPEPLDEAAYHGIVGEIVRTLAPHTEADPAAVLIPLLVGIGNVIGRNAWWVVGACKHFLNCFVCVVGDTSSGRKGTAWAEGRGVLKLLDTKWAEGCIHSGLSTGEGLIWHVRDPIYKTEEDKRSHEPKMVLVDAGVDDKRLFVVETEYAVMLRVMGRDGNTLSGVVRQAWDGVRLQTMSKGSPATATDAHVSIIGHVTLDELRREWKSGDSLNGLGNRIIWWRSRRSRFLPHGGQLKGDDYQRMADELKEVVGEVTATTHGEISFSHEAKDLWEGLYLELEADRHGVFGAVTGRASPMVKRLACIYAVADGRCIVDAVHLRAAMAVWRYSLASAKHIFGQSLGDKIADEILAALEIAPAGMTTTGIRDHFCHNKSSKEIKNALSCLLQHERVRFAEEPPAGGKGRPAQRWFLSGEVRH